MSILDRVLISLIGVLGAINFLVIWEQHKAIEILESSFIMTVEHEQSQEDRIWDLHHQVKVLEKEDERLLAHIKWFVMRRSGTDELRKMETVMAKLEAEE